MNRKKKKRKEKNNKYTEFITINDHIFIDYIRYWS